MKNKLDIFISFFATAVFTMTLSFTACKQDPQKQEPKVIAENKNEFKFDDTKEDDAKFLVDVASFNLEQAELGKLAALKSIRPEVKEFAKMMEAAHSTKIKDLNEFVALKQISVPVSLTDDNKEVYNNLNKEYVDDFDRQYLHQLIEKHTEAIEDYTSQVRKTSDVTLKKWTQIELASLREHLDGAMTLQSKLIKKK